MRPNIWRFTDQSFRLTGNFYELKNIFYENNPVFNADKIEPPLLLWAGKEDYHVNWNQSVAMYLALAGLKKEVKLLLFLKDGHGLLRKSNQLEYTFQVMNWWNHYLKIMSCPKKDSLKRRLFLYKSANRNCLFFD